MPEGSAYSYIARPRVRSLLCALALINYIYFKHYTSKINLIQVYIRILRYKHSLYI